MQEDAKDTSRVRREEKGDKKHGVNDRCILSVHFSSTRFDEDGAHMCHHCVYYLATFVAQANKSNM